MKDNSNKNLKPLISIVVAVYNGAETLKNCLNSIISQDYPNKELLVIDGNSTDQTKSILLEYRVYISHLVSEPDNGIYDAWNKALRTAKGEYITFLGADDAYSSQNVLTKLMQFITLNSQADFVSGKALMLKEDGSPRKIKGKQWQWHMFKKAMGLIVHRGAVHHKRLFENFGQFDTSWQIAGDYEFLLRAGPNLKTAFFPEVIVKVGGSGVSSRLPIIAYKEAFQVQSQSKDISLIQAIIYLIRNIIRYYGGQLKYLLYTFSRR